MDSEEELVVEKIHDPHPTDELVVVLENGDDTDTAAPIGTIELEFSNATMMPPASCELLPPPTKKKRVEFAPGVPLDMETAQISLLNIVLANGECFDGEDAEQVLGVVQQTQEASRKQRMRREPLCQHLASVVAQREKMLQDAMNKNLLRPDDVLFEFFVQKQAMLLKQLQTMQTM